MKEITVVYMLTIKQAKALDVLADALNERARMIMKPIQRKKQDPDPDFDLDLFPRMLAHHAEHIQRAKDKRDRFEAEANRQAVKRKAIIYRIDGR